MECYKVGYRTAVIELLLFVLTTRRKTFTLIQLTVISLLWLISGQLGAIGLTVYSKPILSTKSF